MSEPATHRVLVTVVDSADTAAQMVERLRQSDYPVKQIELVSHDLATESHGVETPKVHPTSETELVEGAKQGGLFGLGSGAAAGILAGVVTGFPGLGLGMLAMGGITGAIVGGMAGLEHADEDTVDLPTREEYEALLKAGHPLVVVHGTADEVHRAKALIEELPFVHQHLHPVHGHEFHEHEED